MSVYNVREYIQDIGFNGLLHVLRLHAQERPYHLLHSAKYRSCILDWMDCPPATFSILSAIIAKQCKPDYICHIARIGSNFDNELLKLKGPSSEGLLHIAVGCGNIDVVKFLLSSGTGLYFEDTDGNLPIHYIGKWSNNVIDTTSYLLDQKMRLCSQNKSGETVAHKVVSYLASSSLYNQWVHCLLKYKLENLFQIQDQDGLTPVHLALEFFDLSLANLHSIVNHETFKINMTDNRGRTILHWAALYGRSVETLEAIVGCGGKYRQLDYCAMSPLHYAARGGNLEAASYLIGLGLQASRSDLCGRDSFQWLKMAPVCKDYVSYSFEKLHVSEKSIQEPVTSRKSMYENSSKFLLCYDPTRKNSNGISFYLKNDDLLEYVWDDVLDNVASKIKTVNP